MTSAGELRGALSRLATVTVRIRHATGRLAEGGAATFGAWASHKAVVRRPTEADRSLVDDLHTIKWITLIPSKTLTVTVDDEIELPSEGARPIVTVESVRAPLIDEQVAVRVVTS